MRFFGAHHYNFCTSYLDPPEYMINVVELPLRINHSDLHVFLSYLQNNKLNCIFHGIYQIRNYAYRQSSVLVLMDVDDIPR